MQKVAWQVGSRTLPEGKTSKELGKVPPSLQMAFWPGGGFSETARSAERRVSSQNLHALARWVLLTLSAFTLSQTAHYACKSLRFSSTKTKTPEISNQIQQCGRTVTNWLTLFLLNTTSAVCFLAATLMIKLRLRCEPDPWRRTVGTGLRSEASKFGLSAFGVYTGSPLDSRESFRWSKILPGVSPRFFRRTLCPVCAPARSLLLSSRRQPARRNDVGRVFALGRTPFHLANTG